MECSSYLDIMLEAEPRELRGDADSALALHLRSCAPCRAEAHEIVRAGRLLAGQLAAESAALPGRRQRRAGWRPIARVGLPAAAVILLSLLAAGRLRNRVISHGAVTQPAASATGSADAVPMFPVVDVEPGQNAVVFSTTNPGITVVWYYSPEGIR